jgi:cytochrome c-type biogenesis protein CcmE
VSADTRAGVPSPVGTPPGRSSRVRVWGVIGVVLVVLGFVLIRGLGDATLYFREADQAVAERSDLGTRRFRIEGIVVDGSIKKEAAGSSTVVSFTIQQNGADVDVVHRGDPPDLFQPNIPVVLEGAFASAAGPALFLSDRIMVRHTNQYQQDNPDRVKDYTDASEG